MKFNGPFRMANNIFAEVMNTSDKRTFELAYSDHAKHVGGNNTELGRARSWVRTVIEVWADRVEIPRALAFQLIPNGGYDVVRRNYTRRLEAHKLKLHDVNQIKDDAAKSAAMEVYHKIERNLDKVTKFEQVDLANWLRKDWVECLSLAHPFQRVNFFSGLNQAKSTSKVGEKTAKPTVGGNRGKPLVTSKHPHAEHNKPAQVSQVVA
jgi:hypothetical protein